MNWLPVYGCLIFFVTVVSWVTSRYIAMGSSKKRPLLIACLLLVFGILFVFKYANFVSTSINDLFVTLHIKMHVPLLNILLPVGISFYTFQVVGYVVDVYKGKILHEKIFCTYALFVSFFPQLVAGPIERANNLLPQFHRVHSFKIDNVVQGLRLILWGYFMKVVVADRLSVYVDAVYSNATHHSGISLLLATLFFTFQIYCDFGGYSNIAVGCAKIMDFDLTTNFRRPYLATSVADFWRRWHISLSTWFKDYVYIPLGGNRCGKYRNYCNLLITFMVSGIWHGANWTFVLWGGLNGLFQIFEKMIDRPKERVLSLLKLKPHPRLVTVINILITFALIVMTWIFFRSNTISDAFLIVKKIFCDRGTLFTNNIDSIIYGVFFIGVLIFSDILQERNKGKHILLENNCPTIRYISYLGVIMVILMFGVFDSSQFIYFQF
jgi:D-alanyl-lipoteichoic acid acyltransferase DltB (MBOAT superfamily)